MNNPKQVRNCEKDKFDESKMVDCCGVDRRLCLAYVKNPAPNRGMYGNYALALLTVPLKFTMNTVSKKDLS